MIERIKDLTFPAINKTEDKLSFTAGAVYRNPDTKKRLVVTGINNNIVEFIEEADDSEFSFSLIKYVSAEKKRVAILNMKEFLEIEGWK